MRLRLAHYRNRFSMFRTYYALRAGLVRADGLEFTILELPDPPSRELEAALIRGDVDLANLYLPNFLERRLEGAPLIGLCTEWESTGKGNGLFVRRNGIRDPADLEGGRVVPGRARCGLCGAAQSAGEALKSSRVGSVVCRCLIFPPESSSTLPRMHNSCADPTGSQAEPELAFAWRPGVPLIRPSIQ
jgi:hypothetical protein